MGIIFNIERVYALNEEYSAAAREVQRAYYREWRKKNPDKVKEKNRRYWEKKAAEEKEKKTDE